MAATDTEATATEATAMVATAMVATAMVATAMEATATEATATVPVTLHQAIGLHLCSPALVTKGASPEALAVKMLTVEAV
jgi:hypothetical protein